MKQYYPEGYLLNTAANRAAMAGVSSLRDAANQEQILEARAALCDREHNLHVDLGVMKGIIPRCEGALGIEEGTVRDIALISREPDNTIAQLLQSQLSEVGINLTINAMDSGSWIAYVRNDHKEQLSLGLTGNAGYSPSKGWTIPLKAFGDVGTGLDTVDHLMDLVMAEKVTLDPDARFDLIKEFQSTILDDALATVIGEKFQYGSFNANVRNVKFHYYGWWELAEAWKAQ